MLGFRILWERPEEGFAYLEREGAELMLDEPGTRPWLAGPLEHPYGRGASLQIEVSYQAPENMTQGASPTRA